MTTRRIAAAEGAVLAALLLALAGLLVWSAWRGFDVTDESYHLYFYANPGEQTTTTLTQYFRLVAALYPAPAPDAVGLRLTRLAVLIAVSAGFALALRAAIAAHAPSLREALPSLAVTTAFAAIGGLLAYTHGPQTPSYNDLTTVCFLGALAIVFVLTTPRERLAVGAARLALSALLGLLLFVQFFTKPSSALVLAGLVAVAFLSLSRARDLAVHAATLTTALASLCASFLLLSDLGRGTLFSFHDLMTASRLPIPHLDIRATLFVYLDGILAALRRAVSVNRGFLVLNLALLGLVAAAALGSAGEPARRRRLLWASLACLAVFAVLVAASGRAAGAGVLSRHVSAEPHLAAATLVLGFVLWAAVRRGDIGARPIAALLVAAALPFGAAAGSANELNVQVALHMAPLFAVTAIGCALLARGGGAGPAPALLRLVLAGMATVAVVAAVVVVPYRVPGPLWVNTVRLDAPPSIAGLHVTPEAARFLAELRQSVAQAPQPPRILAMHDVPGFVLAAGGRAFGTHWFTVMADWQAFNCAKLAGALPAPPPDAVFVNTPVAPAFGRCLAAAGVDLADYTDETRFRPPFPDQVGPELRVLLRRR